LSFYKPEGLFLLPVSEDSVLSSIIIWKNEFSASFLPADKPPLLEINV
jgi:hypothetical protein